MRFHIGTGRTLVLSEVNSRTYPRHLLASYVAEELQRLRGANFPAELPCPFASGQRQRTPQVGRSQQADECRPQLALAPRIHQKRRISSHLRQGRDVGRDHRHTRPPWPVPPEIQSLRTATGRRIPRPRPSTAPDRAPERIPDSARTPVAPVWAPPAQPTGPATTSS